MCRTPNKRVHPTIKSALRDILLMSDKGRKTFGSFYWCRECQGYHVTSRPNPTQFAHLTNATP